MTKKQWKRWSYVIPFPIVFGATSFCMQVFWYDKTYLEGLAFALVSGIPGGLVLFVIWYFSPEAWWE